MSYSEENDEEANPSVEDDDADASSESEDDGADDGADDDESNASELEDDEEEVDFDRTIDRIAANDPTLTEVDLDDTEIGDEGAQRLVEALRSNTVVTVLRLCRNGISGALVSALVGALENNSTLKWLDLSGNAFGDDDGANALALAGFLRNNISLRFLILSGCEIGAEGAMALTAALPSNSTLDHLGLSENNIGNEGASSLARLLPGNSTLTSLDLEGNGIRDVGARELAEALPSNSSLTWLSLEENGISDMGARSFVKALLVNCTVTTFIMGGNDSSEEIEQHVYDLAETNDDATTPQEDLELKVAWLRNLDEGGLSLLGFEESKFEEDVRRLEIVCRVGWLIDSEVDGEKEEAVTTVLDQLEYFMEAEQRCGLFRRLLGVPGRGVEVASSVDETTARTLYRYAVQCGAAPGVLMNLVRAHGCLCSCRDVEHHLIPFMLLATMPKAGVSDVMELLLINPSLVESGISGPNEY